VPNSDTNPPPRSIANQLKLTGISQGTKTIATINNLTFEAGEEQEVKVFNGKRKIRVLEIREKAVRVKAEGEADPIELVLPERVLKFDE
jgi:hypothetical protein